MFKIVYVDNVSFVGIEKGNGVYSVYTPDGIGSDISHHTRVETPIVKSVYRIENHGSSFKVGVFKSILKLSDGRHAVVRDGRVTYGYYEESVSVSKMISEYERRRKELKLESKNITKIISSLKRIQGKYET